nr:xanthine dehydrogenase family protein subunit M [Egibacter rhizosphaerae]
MQVPAQFEYARAESVEDALALLKRFGPEARVVAGGHSLLPMMKLRLARPECLVDINDCFELDYVVEQAGEVRVGALTRRRDLLESSVIGRHFPIVHDAERVIADPVVRNWGTIGGSLCQADPAEDLSTVCEALRAELVIRGPEGSRTVPIDEFHRGPYQSAVDDGEMLTEIRLPVRTGAGSAYEKVERRVGDWAIVAAGTAVWLEGDVSSRGPGWRQPRCGCAHGQGRHGSPAGPGHARGRVRDRGAARVPGRAGDQAATGRRSSSTGRTHPTPRPQSRAAGTHASTSVTSVEQWIWGWMLRYTGQRSAKNPWTRSMVARSASGSTCNSNRTWMRCNTSVLPSRPTSPSARPTRRPSSAGMFLASSAPPKVPVSHPAAAATT